jgi:ribonuclease HI
MVKKMKTSKTISAIFIATIAILLISTASCSTTGMKRSERTTTTMETMDNDIKIVIAQLDITGASLEALMRPNQQDVKKTYDVFEENVSKMESKEKDFIKHADEMKKRGKEYFAEWEKDKNQYENAEIQQLSEQRRDELGAVYGRIAESSVGVKEAYKVYLSDIKELQRYLSNDLTSKGVEALAPVSKRIVVDGDNLKYSLTNLQRAIDRAREEMSQSGR